MQKKKNFYYTQAILKVLMDYDVVTIDQIAKEVGLSEKAVRIKIDSINDYLIENNLGSIEKKRRIGIWLNATDEAKIFIEQKIINGEEESSHGAGLSLGGGINLDRFSLNIAYGKYHVSSSSIILNLAYKL